MATADDVGGVFDMFLTTYPYYPQQHGAAHCAKLLEVWEAVLADVPARHLRAAAIAYMADDNRFFPLPGQLRTAALNMAQPERESALEAWGSVVDMMRPGANWPGKYLVLDADGNVASWGGEPPTFANPITGRVVRALGGFDALQISTERGDEVSNRARFCECYNDLARRETDDHLMLPEVRALRSGGQVGQLTGALAKQLTGRMR